ncbi:MAG: HAMP domain-containing protein [Opitutae bacterium]|nr:HAMP domain-containing protein [Opitutae bacterium]
MPFLHSLSIQRKAVAAILVASITTLLLASACLLAFQWQRIRALTISDLEIQGRIIADSSTAALAFGDERTAGELLGALRSKPHLLRATLHRADQSVFARYEATTDDLHGPPSAPRIGAYFEGARLIVGESVRLNNRTLGTLMLEYDFAAIQRELLLPHLWVLLGVVAAAILLAVIFASVLGRRIAVPIRQLAETAANVAARQDYSLRAPRLSGDEVGQLTDSFNQMLARIESQSATLQRRLLLEQVAGEISTRFINVAPEALDDNLDFALERLAGFMSADRCYLIQVPTGSGEEPPVHIWTRANTGGTPEPWAGLLAGAHPRCRERLAQGESLSCAAGHPPPVDTAEAEWFAATGGRNTLLVPVLLRGEFIAAIGSEWRKPEHLAQPDDVAALRIAAQIFMHTLERRRTNRALEVANSRLLETSRIAGMAEVATGVLHNVGNVLNSVNVSAGLLKEHLDASHLQDLTRAIELIRAHPADFAAFVRDDPRGQALPDLLVWLVDHLAADQKSWQDELRVITENIDHIKSIVAMQQSYARTVGVVEELLPTDLMEDAVRINERAFRRHRIELVRDYQPVPKVSVDKHKALQILINLLGNAKYAVADLAVERRKIFLSVAWHVPDKIRFTVRDTGIGIPPENLTRIFSLGFTTRTDGHGFGLHSGVLAARELGGSLTAHSDGPDCGATFVLELPAPPAA